MDLTPIYKCFYDWVNLAGYNTIWANQNAPRPEYPMVTLNITELSPTEDDYVQYVFNEDTEVYDTCVIGRRLLTFQVQAYSLAQTPNQNGFAMLENINALIFTEEVRLSLDKCNIGYIRSGSKIQLDEPIEGVWHSRWSQNFNFYIITETAGQPVGIIETVEGELCLYDFEQDPQDPDQIPNTQIPMSFRVDTPEP